MLTDGTNHLSKRLDNVFQKHCSTFCSILESWLIKVCLYRSECSPVDTNDNTSGGRCDWLCTHCLVVHPWFTQTSPRFVDKNNIHFVSSGGGSSVVVVVVAVAAAVVVVVVHYNTDHGFLACLHMLSYSSLHSHVVLLYNSVGTLLKWDQILI
jgi:hypothetical protein